MSFEFTKPKERDHAKITFKHLMKVYKIKEEWSTVSHLGDHSHSFSHMGSEDSVHIYSYFKTQNEFDA